MIAQSVETVVAQGVTIDLLRWRKYGARLAEVTTARVLAMPENRGLAFVGTVLPLGTKVTLPALEDRARPAAKVVTVWD